MDDRHYQAENLRELYEGGRGWCPSHTQNVRVTPNEVTGTSIDGKVYVAITGVERGSNQRAVAIIMGVGDDLNWVRSVVKGTAEEVRTSGTPEY